MNNKIINRIILLLTGKNIEDHIEVGKLHQHKPTKKFTEQLPNKTGKEKLKFSVVTPSFNQGKFIEYTIKSILEQNYSNLEYFVQDGGSNDSTVDILQTYKSRLAFESKKDGGQTNALNIGFGKTDGDIMCYVNSDDALTKGSFEFINFLFQKYPSVDVIYGNRLIIDEENKQIGRWILGKFNSETIKKVDFIPQETMFWRRSSWDKVGGKFDEEYKFAMDWDIINRFLDAGAHFLHVPYFLGEFRIHQQQKTSSEINTTGQKEVMQILKRNFGEEATMDILVKELISYRKRCSWNSIMFDLGLRSNL